LENLSLALSHLDNLYRAWRNVRAQIHGTSWPHLAKEFEEIDAAPLRTLRTIQKQLRQGIYQFSPKRGYAKRKSGGSRRGITVLGIKDRIVQRSILNLIQSKKPRILQSLGEIPDLLRIPTSFAGNPGRGVPEAIDCVVQAIREGARSYALSDMKDFFPCVPRKDVVDLFKDNIRDEEFVRLFEAALETELENPQDVESWLELFPLHQVGVAQGSLLSVLVGNLSLRNFDKALNNDNIRTVRYLDDFTILGVDADQVIGGFDEACRELAKLGMTCYLPGDGSHKAFRGLIADGFDFLGCQIHPDGVSPGRGAKKKLLHEISWMIQDAKNKIRQARQQNSLRRSENAYIQTLSNIDKKIRGWGDAYRFVSNRVSFTQMDRAIDELLGDFHQWFARECSRADQKSKRRIFGIALLADTPPKSIDPSGRGFQG
jgi:RNA-directed DNA polymerase